jgi:hypothetical protein
MPEYKYKHLIIDEQSIYKGIWDMYCMACVIYIALVVPFRLSFDEKPGKAFKVISAWVDVTFLIDIILTFFTEVYDENNYTKINTHRDIAVRYLKGWFLFDIISIFPFEQVV